MNLRILPQTLASSGKIPFKAEHPMFAYDVPKTPEDIQKKLAAAKHFVVLGIGGSTLPLKVFLDAGEFNDRVHIVETVDPVCWAAVKNLPDALYFVVSKSGETLEIKALIAELLEANLLSKTIVVTDPLKGSLRKWATENKLPTLEIPSAIGGRFTHFTPFHRALLERLGVNFDSLLDRAKKVSGTFKADSSPLEKLYQQVFESGKSNLILWAYSEKLLGLASWVQQGIAESLGKKDSSGKRVGVFPIVLRGPQDQHSVLQLLMDGPQNNLFWFLCPIETSKSASRSLPTPFESFNKIAAPQILDVLWKSTVKTFEERLSNPETFQPLSQFNLTNLEDVVEAVVTVQAFVEYSGVRLKVSAFDQPGVERGKEIAREILKTL